MNICQFHRDKASQPCKVSRNPELKSSGFFVKAGKDFDNLGFVEMQNAEVRMQNNDFTFGFRLTSKQNHLRFSQVVFLFCAAGRRRTN